MRKPAIVDTYYGRMLSHTTDNWVGDSLAWYGEYAKKQLDVVLNHCIIRSDSVILDVGSHVGAIAVPLALGVPNGKVYCFEPQPLVYQMLCGNLALNGITNAKAFNLGVGKSFRSIDIQVKDWNNSINMGGNELVDNGNYRVNVEALDELFHDQLDKISFIKIDVEGMEKEALQGAEQIIKQSRPIMMIEADRDAKNPELFEYLQSLDYDVRWCLTPLYNPDNYNKLRHNVWGRDVMTIDCLAFPRDRVAPQFALNLTPVSEPPL
jgi:FkbM family methyltransferase